MSLPTVADSIRMTAIPSTPETVIEARRGWRLFDARELVAYRDLLRFLIWRQIKVRYAQSAVGIGWAVIQPVFSMLLFTIVFGSLAGIESDGAPYALFSLTALVPWTYFSNAVTDGVASLVGEANMLRKIYFPRLLIPLSAVAAKLVDFVIGLGCLVVLMLIYGTLPPWRIAVLPLFILMMVVAAAGTSILLTAVAVQYRDVKHAMTFLVQLAMYASPVVYPASLIPESYRLLYAVNPMVGVIEGFRSTILGTQPIPWGLVGVGAASSALLLLLALAVFASKERIFADVA